MTLTSPVSRCLMPRTACFPTAFATLPLFLVRVLVALLAAEVRRIHLDLARQLRRRPFAALLARAGAGAMPIVRMMPNCFDSCTDEMPLRKTCHT